MKTFIAFLLIAAVVAKPYSTYIFTSGVVPSPGPNYWFLSAEKTPETRDHPMNDADYFLGLTQNPSTPNQKWVMMPNLFGTVWGKCVDDWKIVPCAGPNYDTLVFEPLPESFVNTNKVKYLGYGNLRNTDDGTCAVVVKREGLYHVVSGECSTADNAIWHRHEYSAGDKKEL